MPSKHAAGNCGCCGPCETAPTCVLSGSVSGGTITLTWIITGIAITSAVLTNDDGDSYSATYPYGTLTVSKGVCRLWTLTVTNDCGTSTCTFLESNCSVIGPRTSDNCTQCADSDYPSSLITPRQVKITIADVTAGTTNTTDCQYYNNNPFGQEFFSRLGALEDPDCEVDVIGDNAGFFNGDYVLDPCTTTTLWECRYKCSTLNYANSPSGVNYDYFEYNVINLTYVYESFIWAVRVRMDSYVAMYQTTAADTVCDDYIEDLQTDDKLLKSPGVDLYFWLSSRTKLLTWTRNPGTRPGKYYDPGSCETDCNSDVALTKCIQAGDTWTATTSTATNTCKKAVDVEVATGSIAVL